MEYRIPLFFFEEQKSGISRGYCRVTGLEMDFRPWVMSEDIKLLKDR